MPAQYEFADLNVNPDPPEKVKKERFFTIGGSGLPGFEPTVPVLSQNAVRISDGCGTVGSGRGIVRSSRVRFHGSALEAQAKPEPGSEPEAEPESW